MVAMTLTGLVLVGLVVLTWTRRSRPAPTTREERVAAAQRTVRSTRKITDARRGKYRDALNRGGPEMTGTEQGYGSGP